LEELGLNVSEPAPKPALDMGGDYINAVDRFEKELLIHIMKQYAGNLQDASAALGMHRTTLLRKLRKYKIKY
jgi:transcriptional regulator of acetoin/glycerol metabolism